MQEHREITKYFAAGCSSFAVADESFSGYNYVYLLGYTQNQYFFQNVLIFKGIKILKKYKSKVVQTCVTSF